MSSPRVRRVVTFVSGFAAVGAAALLAGACPAKCGNCDQCAAAVAPMAASAVAVGGALVAST